LPKTTFENTVMCSEFSGERPLFKTLHETRQAAVAGARTMSEPADKAWLEAYRRGRDGPWRPRIDVSSPPLSDAFKAHLQYLDGLIADMRALDTAQSEQRIERAMWILRRRGNARQA
jgi:hypothetical protein